MLNQAHNYITQLNPIFQSRLSAALEQQDSAVLRRIVDELQRQYALAGVVVLNQRNQSLVTVIDIKKTTSRVYLNASR